MFVIVECEFDYNNLDHIEVYGPFETEELAFQKYYNWMKNKPSYIQYYIKKVNEV